MRYHSRVPQEMTLPSGTDATEVKALLQSLRDGVDASVVGIFDGARGWLPVSSEKSPGTFWEAFQEIPCLQTDWGEWDRELLASAYARVDCRCGGHRVEAFMFNKRWILIVLGAGRLVTGADGVIAHAIAVLKKLLPSGPIRRASPPPAGGGSGGGGQGPAELGIPLWWIRNRN